MPHPSCIQPSRARRSSWFLPSQGTQQQRGSRRTMGRKDMGKRRSEKRLSAVYALALVSVLPASV